MTEEPWWTVPLGVERGPWFEAVAEVAALDGESTPMHYEDLKRALVVMIRLLHHRPPPSRIQRPENADGSTPA